ncbi:hypothetical protein [Methanobacterium sp. MBAC-LM]
MVVLVGLTALVALVDVDWLLLVVDTGSKIAFRTLPFSESI